MGGKLGNLGCSKNAKISDQIEEKEVNYEDATITSHNGQTKVFKMMVQWAPLTTSKESLSWWPLCTHQWGQLWCTLCTVIEVPNGQEEQ